MGKTERRKNRKGEAERQTTKKLGSKRPEIDYIGRLLQL